MQASLIAAPAFIQSEFGIAPADAIHCGDECRGIAAITSGAAITAQSVCSLVLGPPKVISEPATSSHLFQDRPVAPVTFSDARSTIDRARLKKSCSCQ